MNRIEKIRACVVTDIEVGENKTGIFAVSLGKSTFTVTVSLQREKVRCGIKRVWSDVKHESCTCGKKYCLHGEAVDRHFNVEYWEELLEANSDDYDDYRMMESRGA